MNLLLFRNASICVFSVFILSSCALLEEMDSISKKISSKGNGKKEFRKINDSMVNKKLILYSEWFSKYEDVLDIKCSYMSEWNIVDRNVYVDFIQKNNLDSPISFVLFKDTSDGLMLKGNRCDFFENSKDIESEYYLCNKDKNLRECFALSLLTTSTNVLNDTSDIIRKKSIDAVCDLSKESCDAYEFLSGKKYTKVSYTSLDIKASQTAIDNGKKTYLAKVHSEKVAEEKAAKEELKLKELAAREELRETQKREKEEKIAQVKKDACEAGNDNSCWSLYVANEGTYYLDKACDFGHAKACVVVKNNREEESFNEQKRMNQEMLNQQEQLRAQQEQQREQQTQNARSQALRNSIKEAGNRINKAFEENNKRILQAPAVPQNNKRKCTSEVNYAGQLETKCEDNNDPW